ncbi:uncharacterized protein JN550_013186 [Neoarthrinium moseri]|uniref:uncharacterized protein n=1 Tax=Neoarthrinium moseri TaxID=1658444 RepID=UPI001FDB1F99|nr:uncharacterized protein JN550_013186 [Neoarthrinium moseri]KAI1857553.1 hypothetical protein JN550_013186 [Neoarthrinium moseri]
MGLPSLRRANALKQTFVVPADGIGSKPHELILGAPVRAVSTGYTVYRAAMSPKQFKNAPWLKETLLEAARRPQGRFYAAENQHIVLVVSPRLISFALTLPDAGDSAHSFIPTSMNGGTMALEDAMSLAECLRLGGANGYKKAVKVHKLLRFYTKGKWLWTHNAERYATDNFYRAKDHLEIGTPFSNTNLPPGHKPESWTLTEQMEKEKAGLVEDLTSNGDWSL